MCFIMDSGAAIGPELDRQGRARSARSRNTRRLNGLAEAEERRLGTMFGGQGRDVMATIEAARRALQEPEGTPTAVRTATQRATKPSVSRPSPFGKLPTIGGS